MSQSLPIADGGASETSPCRVAPAIVLLFAFLIGILVAMAALPTLFRAVPNDLSRVETILSALHGADPPRLVVFGDSRGEADIDAAQLGTLLPGRPLAYNLSWHSQRLSHAFLLYQELPPSVQTVVQVVSLQDLADPKPGDKRISEAMRAYGYEPSRSTIASMEYAFGAAQCMVLRVNRVQTQFRSRWGIRQSFDQLLRMAVRRDLLLDRERGDLFFPTAYSRRADEQSFNAVLASVGSLGNQPAISAEKLRLLRRIADFGDARGVRIVLVLPPTYSRALLPDHAQRTDEVRSRAKELKLQLIDVSRILSDNDFVDPLHASVAGARSVTSMLALRLRSVN